MGTAYIEILPSTNKLAPGIRKELGQVEKQAKAAGQRSGSTLGSTLMGGVRKAVGVAGIGAAIVGGAALQGGITRLLDIENAQAKLRGLGHDANSIGTIMDSALASVKGTAFGMGEAATTAATAVAAGIKPGKELTKYLTLTGDAATIAGSSMGEMGSILNKVQTSGRAYTSELNMLADRGLPIFQWLQGEYDVSAVELRKMVESGKVDAVTFRKVIEENIGGAALASGDTTVGAFKNLKASLGRIGANFLTGLGFDGLKGAFSGLTDLLGPFEDKAAGIGDALGKAFRDATGWVKENKDVVFAVGAALATAAAGVAAYTAYVRISTAVTAAWATVQKILNGTLKANPVGIVITALALLVGGLVLAYRKSDTFRKIVQGAWAGIKKGIDVAWKAIKPVLAQFNRWVKDVLGPALKRFWTTAVKPTFAAIGKAIKFAWNRVVKPAFSAMRFYLTKVLFPVLKFLWNNVVKPVFKNIGNAISVAWKYVIKPAFSRMSSMVKGLPKAFRTAKDGISKAWSAIKAAVAKPVNFVINTVWNDGLRKVINAIPGVKDLGRMGGIPGYADGGWTGPGGKYQPAGIVHGDEFVVNKASRRKFEKSHPGALDYLNNYGELPGFASGGRVWPLKGGVTSTYPGHSGVDLNAPNDYGAPVHAVTSGMAYPYSSGWAGNNSVRLVGGGTSQIYAHMMRRGKLGPVSAGDVIGYVGSEGNSTGPHLHFQISPMGYGPALSFLQGAKPPKGGGGGFFQDFTKNISSAKSGLSAAIKGVKSMANSGWGALIRKGASSLIGDAADYAADKIPGGSLLKKLGVFDNGGILEPGMLAFNASKKPEAVYNHKQFRQFAEAQAGAGSNRRVALTITNWRDGTGYMEEIAEGAVNGHSRFSAQLGRMGGN